MDRGQAARLLRALRPAAGPHACPDPGLPAAQRGLDAAGIEYRHDFLDRYESLSRHYGCLDLYHGNLRALDAEGNKIKHYYPNESTGIATGMLIAALHRAGLATLTHTPSPMKFLNEILERPRNERPFLLLVVGYPAAGARLLIGILAEMSKRIRNMNEKLATAELEATLRGYWH